VRKRKVHFLNDSWIGARADHTADTAHGNYLLFFIVSGLCQA
jgi:hypothetical protein